MRRQVRRIVAVLTVTASASLFFTAPAGAEPTVDEIAPRLPVIVPTASNWQPIYPSPYDETRGEVTDADINALREMCQWYTAQYETLMTQIDNFNNNLIRSNGDYGVAGNQQLAEAVTANIDQSVAFLTPRAQSLTHSRDHAGNEYFPLYQGESFHLLWEHLSNVSAGITGHQPAWFVGPSVQRVLRWGSRINRSHVCR
jgi:hypothetical protein